LPAWIGLFAALAFILGATLSPSGNELPEFVGCIVCGAHGWSDALSNVVLFLPFGAALAAVGRTGARAMLTGFFLSCAIELAQTVIPGRDPSLGDVCFNTLGTAAGLWTAGLAVRWLLPGSRPAARLSLLAATLAFAVFGLTGRLLAPSLPARAFSAWYTAALPDMEWYHGRVLRTALGPIAFGPNHRPDRDAVRRLLLEGAPLRIDAIAAQSVRGLAPLFVIEDDDGNEIFLVGPDRDDLVLRYRSRASLWRLDQPDIRLRHAFAHVHAGDTLHITVQGEGNAYCLSLNQTARCGIGYSVGSGWALLYYPQHLPAWMVIVLEAAWVAGLAFPLGLWARRRPETAVAFALFGTALFVLPPLSGLLRTPPYQIAGAGIGVLLGGGLQAWLKRRQRARGVA
jgi:VanZ family protein